MDWILRGMARAGWGPEHPLLNATAWVVVTVTALTLLTMVYVLMFSARARRTRRRRLKFNTAWRTPMAQASIGGEVPDVRAPLRARERLWWLMLWNRMQRPLRGQSREHLNALLQRTGMDKHAMRLLRGLSVRQRLVALETLRHLGDASAWSRVAPLCRHRNRYVGLAAAHALMSMAPRRGLAFALEIGLSRDDWSPRHLADLCQSAGVEACTPVLLSTLASATPQQASTLAVLLPFAEPRALQTWARGVLQQDRPRALQLGALQVLGELADPRDHSNLVNYLHHDDENLRLAALRGLRRQVRREDTPHFLVALLDRVFAIRHDAADVIAALPGMTTAAGDALLARIEDPYGRDQLMRALAARHAPDAGVSA